MKTDPKDPIARLRERWGGYYNALEEPARRRLWLGAALIVALLGGLALLLGRTRWTVLYTGLEARDAAAITEKLKASKVPYRLALNGTEVQVPDTAVFQERLDLAAQGLPQGQGKGWELMDDGNNLLLSEEGSRLNRQRALQGELERSIMSLRGVEAVRVHLVTPERRLFNKDDLAASASIVVKMQAGVQLGDQEALSIAYLVSHAVEGLKPEAVAIVDTEGHDLGLSSPGGGAQMGTRIESARKVERHLHDQVQSMLDEALGPDKAIVRVHAELDFDDQHVTKEIYEAPTPKGGLVREEVQDSAQDGSAAGTNANTTLAGNSGPQVVGGPRQGGNHSDRRVVYELNKTVQDIAQGAGSLKHVSVSVLLKEALPPAELASLSDAVNKTVGIDAARGDQMSLAVIPAQALAAAGSQAKAAAATMADEGRQERSMELVSTLAPWVVAAILVLALSALAWRALRLPSGAALAARASARPAPGDAGHPEGGSVPGFDPAVPASEEELRKLIERYPSSAAQVLRRMMSN